MLQIEKLRQCPHCGHKNTKISDWWVAGPREPHGHKEYAVLCMNCGSQGPNDMGWSGAMKGWNMRRPMDRLLDNLKKYVEELIDGDGYVQEPTSDS